MSDSSLVGGGNPPPSRNNNSYESLGWFIGWVPVVISVIAIGFAIYLLGWGDLSSTGRGLAIAGLVLALLAFLASLWRVIDAAPAVQCDGLKGCVAWLLALGGGAVVVFVLVWVMLNVTGTVSGGTATAAAGGGSSSIGLPLIVIVGVIVLLIVISLVAFVFSVLGLASAKEALGLPDGSVRAIIALMLLVLFAILSLYLYNSVSTAAKDSPAIDVAKQLITLLGTLVTAVSSFYFGTNAVSSEHSAMRNQAVPPKVVDSEPEGRG